MTQVGHSPQHSNPRHGPDRDAEDRVFARLAAGLRGYPIFGSPLTEGARPVILSHFTHDRHASILPTSYWVSAACPVPGDFGRFAGVDIAGRIWRAAILANPDLDLSGLGDMVIRAESRTEEYQIKAEVPADYIFWSPSFP